MNDHHRDFPRRAQMAPSTIQRSKLCVIESEKEWVLVSASIVATVVVQARSDAPLPVDLHPDIPGFWLGEQEMVRVMGESSLEKAVHRLGFVMVSLGTYDWAAAGLLTKFRQVFPGITATD